MYPLGFDDFSESPVIILSPHQHQFDPISRAAHSWHHTPAKPVMDRRSYDTPLSPGHSKKRSREECDSQMKPVLLSSSTPTESRFAAAAVPGLQNNSLKSTVAQIIHAPTGTFSHEAVVRPQHGDASIAGASDPSPQSSSALRRKISRHNTAYDVSDIERPVAATPAADATNDLPVEPSMNTNPVSETTMTDNPSLPIDEYTRTIGISWRSPETSSLNQQCLRGWHTFLRNYFTLTSPQIVAQNKQRLCHLVQSSEGWFLFDEDLKEGRMLAQTKLRALENLTCEPPVFDSDVVLKAGMERRELARPVEEVPADEHMVVGDMDLD